MAETLNQAWARAIVEELVRAGVEHALVCPGSRSTPLALACAEKEGLHTWSVLDERSAAFMALGIAKESGRPALALATSGTAGANFYPAVIEAGMAHVPLVLITADRPPELQGWGAAQTVDQRALFGAHARLWLDVGIPEASTDVLAHLRAQVTRAVAAACHPPAGAVHLNVPFREPLAPAPDAPPLALAPPAVRAHRDRPPTRLSRPVRSPEAGTLTMLAERMRSTEKGLIVCGPRDQMDALGGEVSQLGDALGYPVLAEAASNVRYGWSRDVIGAYDALLRYERFAQSSRPDLVIRIGGRLTSKDLQAWLDRSGAYTVCVSEAGELLDPQHSASLVLAGDACLTCRELARTAPDRRSSEWLRRFRRAEAIARSALAEAFLADDFLTEPRVAHEVVAALPSRSTLFLSSSMPIRDVDAFALESGGSSVRVLANRGANGIDGVTSTALGVAMARGQATVLLTGDLAFLHDLSGLLAAARHRLSLVVVVVNNDGGGIFSFLPIARGTSPERFEALFATPHGRSFRFAAELFGARYHAPEGARALKEVVRESAGAGGLHLVEVRTDRATNVMEHRVLHERVCRALEAVQ